MSCSNYLTIGIFGGLGKETKSLWIPRSRREREFHRGCDGECHPAESLASMKTCGDPRESHIRAGLEGNCREGKLGGKTVQGTVSLRDKGRCFIKITEG